MVARVKPIFEAPNSSSALFCSAEGLQNAKSDGHFADQTQFQCGIAGGQRRGAEWGWALPESGDSREFVGLKAKPILAESQWQFVLCFVQWLPPKMAKLAIKFQKSKANFSLPRAAGLGTVGYQGLSYRHGCGS